MGVAVQDLPAVLGRQIDVLACPHRFHQRVLGADQRADVDPASAGGDAGKALRQANVPGASQA
jgi:hypothetical protein